MSLVYSGRRVVPAVKPGGVLVGCPSVEPLPKRAILERAGKPVEAEGGDAKRLNCDEAPEKIAPTAKDPSRTLLLLRHLPDSSDQDILKKEIGATIAYVQAR